MSRNVNWGSDSRTWISNPSVDLVDEHGDKVRQRTLILCFDGTGDTFDNDNSNVVQLTSLLKKDDPTKQMVYYQTGIGTGSEADARFEFVRNITKSLDSMFAITLGDHVLGGYEFLMDHYHEGDSICIFGFSRGAYTARALAGMIQKVGLLPTGNRQQLPFAYQMFADQEQDPAHVEDFKNTFAINVKIQFVGVWDTVESVGIFPRHLPFVSNNTAIRCFRHAIALDEHRAKFPPNFMHFPEEKEKKSKKTESATSPLAFDHAPAWYGESLKPPAQLTRNPSTASDATAVEDESPQDHIPKKAVPKPKETDAEEVWFAGVHTDVGGGSVENKTRHSLARISLRWMIRECWKTNTGILFDADKLQNVVGMNIDKTKKIICDAPPRLNGQEKAKFLEGRISSLEPGLLQRAWQAFNSPGATLADVLNSPFREELPSIYGKNPTEMPFLGEDVEELLDALSPMYDQLQLAPGWWLLEYLPFWTTKEKALHEKKDEKRTPFPGFICAPWNLKEHLTNWVDFGTQHLSTHHFTVNKGRGRKVYKHIMERGMPVHPSVLTRLEAVDQHYRTGTYVPLIQPNIPGYTGKNSGNSIRPMTADEWIHNKVGAGAHPWFYWWTPDTELTSKHVEKVKKGHKEAKASLKKLKTDSHPHFYLDTRSIVSAIY